VTGTVSKYSLLCGGFPEKCRKAESGCSTFPVHGHDVPLWGCFNGLVCHCVDKLLLEAEYAFPIHRGLLFEGIEASLRGLPCTVQVWAVRQPL
jgi:hypothetical protein